MRISKRVLIADTKEGGLKLVDLKVRREALRLKIVKKYLYSKEIYGWKYCMKECLEKIGACSQSNLFMCLVLTEIWHILYHRLSSP